MNTQKVTIKEVEQLLQDGKKVSVKSLDGQFVPILKYIKKGILPTYLITLADGKILKASEKHLCFSQVGWISVKHMRPGITKLLCENKSYVVINSVEYIGEYPIVDISVDSQERCYFGNGILNHNSGKSFCAATIAANAQKQGFTVVYFDSESAVDPSFLKRIGCDISDKGLIYVQASSIEFVFETMEQLLGQGRRWLFILDSLAMTPCKTDIEGDFNPLSSMAVKPRILSKGLSKLVQPIANTDSVFLILNQLKTNITKTPFEAMVTPYFTPGGRAVSFACSLIVYLTARKGKASFIEDENGYRIGTEVKAKLEKSRFGTQFREIGFKILWSDENPRFQEDETWFEIITHSEDLLSSSGIWHSLKLADGTEKKFNRSSFVECLKEEQFKTKVLEILENELVHKFANKTGHSSKYYNIDGEEEKPDVLVEEGK